MATSQLKFHLLNQSQVYEKFLHLELTLVRSLHIASNTESTERVKISFSKYFNCLPSRQKHLTFKCSRCEASLLGFILSKESTNPRRQAPKDKQKRSRLKFFDRSNLKLSLTQQPFPLLLCRLLCWQTKAVNN